MDRSVHHEDYFDWVVSASLRQFSVWLIAIYSGYFVARYLTWPEGFARNFTLFGLVVQITLLAGLAVSLRRPWYFSRKGAVHGALIAWLVGLCSSFHFISGLEPYYTNIILLTVVGCGVLLLDTLWTSLTIGGLLGLWLITNYLAQAHMAANDFLPLFCATLVSGALFYHRRLLFKQQFSILESQRTQNELLSQSLQQAQEDQCEFETRAAQRALAREVTLSQLKAEVAARVGLEAMLNEVGPDNPLGRLASGVAHDFANLVTILQMNFEELRSSPRRAAEDRELLTQALCELDEVSTLMRQLLAYSRRQSITRSVHEADKLLSSFVESLGTLLPENIAVNVGYGAPECPILGDQAQLQQALLNLCLNSADAMPSGGVLSLTSQIEGEHLIFTVRDTGAGMNLETLSQARDPYYTSKEFHSGRGLGLSVVDGILNQHEGELLLTSTEGKGTQACIVLPIHHPQKPDPRKVLLVEDEDVTRLVVTRYLKKCGYQVYEAESAQEAKSLFLECVPYPGLVVTDIVLPDENGMALAEYLTHVCPDLRILFTSAHTDAKLEKLNLPCSYSFLCKPYGLTQFRETVESL